MQRCACEQHCAIISSIPLQQSDPVSLLVLLPTSQAPMHPALAGTSSYNKHTARESLALYSLLILSHAAHALTIHSGMSAPVHSADWTGSAANLGVSMDTLGMQGYNMSFVGMTLYTSLSRLALLLDKASLCAGSPT